MKIRIISLPQRDDRREAFVENNGKFLEGHDWEFMPGVEGRKLNHQRIKEIGFEIKDALESGNLRKFGQYMHLHWKLKTSLSNKMAPNTDCSASFDHEERRVVALLLRSDTIEFVGMAS